jgi:hypothetical protein
MAHGIRLPDDGVGNPGLAPIETNREEQFFTAISLPDHRRFAAVEKGEVIDSVANEIRSVALPGNPNVLGGLEIESGRCRRRLRSLQAQLAPEREAIRGGTNPVFNRQVANPIEEGRVPRRIELVSMPTKLFLVDRVGPRCAWVGEKREGRGPR